MIVYLTTFVASFVCSMWFTRVVRDTVILHELLDRLHEDRDVQETPVLRFGGIAMVMACVVGLVVYLISSQLWKVQTNLPSLYVLFSAGIIVVTGILDDLYHLGFKQKLFGQILASIVVLAEGTRIPIPEFSINGFPLSTILSIGITFLWLIGIVNAFNLIDGLDGLAGGLGLMSFVALTVLYALQQVIPNGITAFIIGGSIVGFLVYNAHPASIFMGDTGSMFIGFTCAIYAIPSFNGGNNLNSLAFIESWVPGILIIAIPILDTLTAVVRRSVNGRSIFSPDRDHLHHRIMNVFRLNHQETVLSLYVVGVLLSVAGLWFASMEVVTARIAILGGVLIGLGIGYYKLGFINRGMRHPEMLKNNDK